MSDSHPLERTDDPALGAPPPAAEGGVGPATIDSVTLLRGRRELTIQHGSESYRLRLTRMNKLILTK